MPASGPWPRTFARPGSSSTWRTVRPGGPAWRCRFFATTGKNPVIPEVQLSARRSPPGRGSRGDLAHPDSRRKMSKSLQYISYLEPLSYRGWVYRLRARFHPPASANAGQKLTGFPAFCTRGTRVGQRLRRGDPREFPGSQPTSALIGVSEEGRRVPSGNSIVHKRCTRMPVRVPQFMRQICVERARSLLLSTDRIGVTSFNTGA
jgi:hypothetical protein